MKKTLYLLMCLVLIIGVLLLTGCNANEKDVKTLFNELKKKN